MPTESETTSTSYIPEMSRMGSREYSAEHYKFLNEIIESKSAREFYVQIINTDFSHQCVNAFFKILTSGFDKNAILAKNTQEGIRTRIIDFQIKLNLMVTECHESDIQNPAFLTFQENILDAFKDFVSRSITERDQLLRQEFNQVIDDRRPPMQSPGQPQQQQQQQQPVTGRFGRRG